MYYRKKVLYLLISTLALVLSTCYGIEKKIVFVLGMHRSGTSATMGALEKLRLYIGEPNNLVQPGIYNKKGFFEHRPLVKINEWFLEKMKSSWSDTQPLFIDWNSEKTRHFKDIIKKYLEMYFSRRTVFGLKDPRLCLLLPAYISAAQELGYKPKFVIVLRNPQEIAASLAKRNHMPEKKALALTKKYVDSAFTYTRDYDKIVISFDDLVNQTDQVITKLKQFLPELEVTPATRYRVKSFITKDLKHHNLPKPVIVQKRDLGCR